MTTIKEVERYLENLIVYNKTEDTITSYRDRLYGFINDMKLQTFDDICNINLINLEEWLRILHDKNNSESTKKIKISTLNGFYNYLKNRDLIKHNPCNGLEAIKIPTVKQTYITEDEEVSILKYISNNNVDSRIKAIVYIIIECGLRIGDIINLKIHHVVEEDGEWFLEIHNGKGKKYRRAIITKEIKKSIDDYLLVRKDCEYDNLFISNKKQPMHKQTISRALKKLCKQSGIQNYEDITVHSFRRGLATRLDEAQVPLGHIQFILGHSHASTTTRYIKSNERNANNSSLKHSLMQRI